MYLVKCNKLPCCHRIQGGRPYNTQDRRQRGKGTGREKGNNSRPQLLEHAGYKAQERYFTAEIAVGASQFFACVDLNAI